MSLLGRCQFSLALVFATCVGSSQLFAQVDARYNPYSSYELKRIQAESVGNGYTVDSTIRNIMQGVEPRTTQGTEVFVTTTAATIGAGSSRPTSKPFSSVSSAPTVSPYLNLFNDNLSDEYVPTYNTVVRPMLQQQRFNEQVQRQNIQLERQIQAVAAQSAYEPRGSEQQYPTGHRTLYFNYGNFYPALNQRR